MTHKPSLTARTLERIKSVCHALDIAYQETVDMRPLTSLKIGGVAPLVIYPTSIPGAIQLLNALVDEAVPWKIMGGGSNLLIPDRGALPWVIIRFDRLNRIERHGDTFVQVEAGVPGPKLTSWTSLHGLGGCEFLSGIPGQIGGLTFMNAGAFGRQMSDILHRVWVWQPGHDEPMMVTAEPELFGYRRSPFTRDVILKVELALTAEDPTRIHERLQEMKAYRLRTQPLQHPSAGCAFKNPLFGRLSAGYLIDRAGLRGHRRGGAMISDKHCNFIINIGNATYRDVAEVIRDAQQIVAEKFGILLEPELIFWHDEDVDFTP